MRTTFGMKLAEVIVVVPRDRIELSTPAFSGLCTGLFRPIPEPAEFKNMQYS